MATGGCVKQETPASAAINAHGDAVPADAAKGTPATDPYRPVVHSDAWETPVPMEGPVNTAGAEDSPFIAPDGDTFFFFFTPNVSVPVEKQLLDGVTGIWWTRRANGSWTEPERVVLGDGVSLDGAECLQGDTLWFGSVRAGNIGAVDVYTARYADGRWTDVKNAGEPLNGQYDIGEFHVTDDGNTIYFGWSPLGTDNSSLWTSNRTIWVSRRVNGAWQAPILLGPGVNGGTLQDQPFITPDGGELWYTGISRLGYIGPAVYRCVRQPGGEWGPAEEVVSNFAGEPTLDGRGNIYFVHHYYTTGGRMLEADIYVARKK